MSNYQSILVDRDERVGIVTLNRPKGTHAIQIFNLSVNLPMR